jgi:hypothetical protein
MAGCSIYQRLAAAAIWKFQLFLYETLKSRKIRKNIRIPCRRKRMKELRWK